MNWEVDEVIKGETESQRGWDVLKPTEMELEGPFWGYIAAVHQ